MYAVFAGSFVACFLFLGVARLGCPRLTGARRAFIDGAVAVIVQSVAAGFGCRLNGLFANYLALYTGFDTSFTRAFLVGNQAWVTAKITIVNLAVAVAIFVVARFIDR